MKRTLLAVILIIQLFSLQIANGQTQRQIGLRDNTPEVFAFTHARVVVNPQTVIENATLVIRKGVIEAIGSGITIPTDAWTTDLKGKTIYPGFIEMHSQAGLPAPKDIAEAEKNQAPASRHWNPQVRSQYSSLAAYKYDDKAAGELRSQGFVAAHILPGAGVFSGQGSVVKLADDVSPLQMIKPDFTHGISFRATRELGRGYPGSEMGSIALIRQSFQDARWYKAAHEQWQKSPATVSRPEFNPAISALSDALDSRMPFIMDVTELQEIFRAAQLAAEFNINLWAVGSGHEYQRVQEIKRTNIPLIIPVNFPDKPDASRPELSINLSLEELRHWYQAPQNAAILQREGISFALTTHGLKKKDDFLKNIRIAVKQGLEPQKALASLTTIPATMLGLNSHGTLEKGKSACFFISNGDIFDDNTQIEQVWVQGKKHVIKEDQLIAGEWKIENHPFPGATLKISARGRSYEAEITHPADSKTQKVKNLKWENQRISFTLEKDSLQQGMRMSANVNQNKILGFGEKSDGTLFNWTATRLTDTDSSSVNEGDKDKKPAKTTPLELHPLYPAMEYGVTSPPVQPGSVLVRNATIWTQGPQGVMENADMLVERGQISRVGRNLTAPAGAMVIDAGGRHVTPGIIDPHLHASIAGGVNEMGDAITSETRISDVIDANSIWIYRLLSGGLTTANLFHGSANPIGGQSAVIKMRWGVSANELLMEGSYPGLKFALGENVKRTEGRYPNTRMGAEQIIRDAFLAAVQYEKDKQLSKGTDRRGRDAKPFRIDLQLEPILEVIKGERLAHVHAYRQDEMLMIMRIAEEFGFRVASFEHTVEGYKIADELREHGAAAIVWTDWSSFKMEANDAIYQNARLLSDAGVLTSLHSDNTQLATRMNWEGGKLLYSGVSETVAMDMLTLNPAKILRIDHRTGTLEPGKDADFVIWNGHPLSAFTIADETWIEGRKYFDREVDREMQQQVINERSQIIERLTE
jgi:imidazolonepropionase-like amidohydrolase